MKDSGLVRATEDENDIAGVRALLLDALAVLDASSLPAAASVATFVSHALEVLSPGADPFADSESDLADTRL